MAGYGVKDANRACRERKDTKPETVLCRQCEDTGFVVMQDCIRECPLCEVTDVDEVAYA